MTIEVKIAKNGRINAKVNGKCVAINTLSELVGKSLRNNEQVELIASDGHKFTCTGYELYEFAHPLCRRDSFNFMDDAGNTFPADTMTDAIYTVDKFASGEYKTRNIFAEYAVSAMAQEIATKAEIENAQANDVKVTEQDNSNVTIDDNGTDFNALAADAFVKTTRQADALKDKIARDAEASDDDNVFDLVYDAKAERIAEFVADIRLDNQEANERDAEPRTVIIPIRTKKRKDGRLTVKYGDANVSLQAAVEAAVDDYRHEPITIINQYGEEFSHTAHIGQRRIGRARDSVKAFVHEVAGWKPMTEISDEMYARLARERARDKKDHFYLDKIFFGDAQPSDSDNVFDLLPDIDDLPDIESEWQYWQGIYKQIKREQGDFATKIGDATVIFRDWQIVEIYDGFTSYKKVNGKRQYRISGRLVSRNEFEEFVLIGTYDKPATLTCSDIFADLPADPYNSEDNYHMARYITFAHGKTNYAIRSTDFLRAEKALTALKNALDYGEYQFGINLFDADEITPVYYVAELDGSEDDREEIFDADVIPTVDDCDDELIDEPLPQPTNIYDELLNTPVTEARIEELADAINDNRDAYHEADFMLTVAERNGDTKRVAELKTFMDGCIADAYQLNAALDNLIKPHTPPTVEPDNGEIATFNVGKTYYGDLPTFRAVHNKPTTEKGYITVTKRTKCFIYYTLSTDTRDVQSVFQTKIFRDETGESIKDEFGILVKARDMVADDKPEPPTPPTVDEPDTTADITEEIKIGDDIVTYINGKFDCVHSLKYGAYYEIVDGEPRFWTNPYHLNSDKFDLRDADRWCEEDWFDIMVKRGACIIGDAHADDFNSQLAELTANAKAAHAAEKNAMHELDKACDTYHKAEETCRDA